MAAGETWEVDLGANALIDNVVFYPRTDAASMPTAFIDIFLASDLVNPVYSSGNFVGTSQQTFSSLNVTGQIVRVSSTGTINSFAELEVNGSIVPEPNVLVLLYLELFGCGLAVCRRAFYRRA